MWWKISAVTIFALVLMVTGTIFYGKKRWQARSEALWAKSEAARLPTIPKWYSSHELGELPLPVRRYFRTVLKEGHPLITTANMQHSGTFNMRKTGEQWTPFNSTQRIIARRPGFVWDARIRMAPALDVFVRDAYVAGEGVLTAQIFGLLTVAEQPRTPELAQGELLRFLAEAVWYPTLLLPGQDVVWEAIDASQARATLSDGGISVSLLFHFDEQGLVETVRSEARHREVDGKLVVTPWQGRFWNYKWRDGMLVPLSGEVAWLLADGPHYYWRGELQQIKYGYAP